MVANRSGRKASSERGGPAPQTTGRNGSDAAFDEAAGPESDQETGPDVGADVAPQAGDDAAAPLSPGLYLVATPIGNAGDVTLRGLDILRRADVLAAEDTRSLRRLLEMHGVSLRGRRIVSYHDANGAERRPGLLAALKEGRSVALTSEAGTPLIADPGYKLAREAAEMGAPVTAAPGANAALAALCLSGLPTDRFLFAGFLPPRTAARRRELQTLAQVPAALVFYESPRRTADCLADMADVLGPAREAALCRELTKKFEQVLRGTLSELAERVAAEAPRGEIVIAAAPPPPATMEEADLDRMISAALETASVKDAAREVAARTGLPKREVYARALRLSRER